VDEKEEPITPEEWDSLPTSSELEARAIWAKFAEQQKKGVRPGPLFRSNEDQSRPQTEGELSPPAPGAFEPPPAPHPAPEVPEPPPAPQVEAGGREGEVDPRARGEAPPEESEARELEAAEADAMYQLSLVAADVRDAVLADLKAKASKKGQSQNKAQTALKMWEVFTQMLKDGELELMFSKKKGMPDRFSHRVVEAMGGPDAVLAPGTKVEPEMKFQRAYERILRLKFDMKVLMTKEIDRRNKGAGPGGGA
jgi:hypothetical protein